MLVCLKRDLVCLDCKQTVGSLLIYTSFKTLSWSCNKLHLPFHQIWDQCVNRQINNNLSILFYLFSFFLHLANNKIPVIATIHLHWCYSLHVDVTYSFFYDWYIDQRYFIDTSIDTLLILGTCQCGATILGDLPTFSNWGGRNTGISIYFLNNKIIPIFVTKLEGVECRACSSTRCG